MWTAANGSGPSISTESWGWVSSGRVGKAKAFRKTCGQISIYRAPSLPPGGRWPDLSVAKDRGPDEGWRAVGQVVGLIQRGNLQITARHPSSVTKNGSEEPFLVTAINYGVIATVTERSEEMPVVQSLDLLRCALQQPPGEAKGAPAPVEPTRR